MAPAMTDRAALPVQTKMTWGTVQRTPLGARGVASKPSITRA